MDKLTIKTSDQIRVMARGGKLLAEIRNKLAEAVKPGITGVELEEMANEMINLTGGQASFKLVAGYRHATCLNVNEVVVHGIPNEYILKDGDKVGIDVGLYLDGFHTDTSVTVIAGKVTPEKSRFLETGKRALRRAIEVAVPGKRIADISLAMQKVIEEAGYSAVQALTGHGIGTKLHEEPAIPCFWTGNSNTSPLVREGMVLAIEVMYNEGGSDVMYKNDDGWTIVTADGKISGLFEQTVAVSKSGPVVLTA